MKLRRAVLLLSLLLLAGCSAGQPTTAGNSAPPVPAPAPAPQPQPDPPPAKARILAVGDLLPHLPVVAAAKTGEDQYDFKPIFAPVRPWIEGADLAVGDMETNFEGKLYPWSGYPAFNSPEEFARDVKAVGFDAVTNANNHALDYDGPGLIRTAEALDRYGLPHTGVSRTHEERDQILVANVGPSIKMAILSYTYATNGIPLPNPWSVNMLDPDRMKSDIHRARQLPGVDLVAVALHFGQEYAREPDAEQEKYVQLSLEAGADIILGDHVHVLQKIEVRQVRDDFGRTLPRAVAFCMGNFVHDQEGLYESEGLMFVVDVKKEKGVTTVENVSFVPTWVHPYMENGTKKFRVVAVEQALRDYEAKQDPLITAADYARLQAVWADITKHVVGSPEVAVYHVDRPVTLAGN